MPNLRWLGMLVLVAAFALSSGVAADESQKTKLSLRCEGLDDVTHVMWDDDVRLANFSESFEISIELWPTAPDCKQSPGRYYIWGGAYSEWKWLKVCSDVNKAFVLWSKSKPDTRKNVAWTYHSSAMIDRLSGEFVATIVGKHPGSDGYRYTRATSCVKIAYKDPDVSIDSQRKF